ncbi:MAG: hypothetical protein ABI035_13870 [Gemmatimonadaceae bacterium]
MATNKPMARAGYLLAALLVIGPLFDGTTQLLPIRAGDERWRFGAVGSLSNLLLLPLLGLLLAVAVSEFTDARRTKRVLGAICAILAFCLAALSVGFILDYFQVRTAITPRLQHATAVATSIVLVKNVLTIVTLFLLTRAGYIGPKAALLRSGPRLKESAAASLLPLGGSARAE